MSIYSKPGDFMQFRFLLVFFCLILLVPPTRVSAQEVKEPFYSQATRAVVRLVHSVDIRNERQDQFVTEVKPDGTGFFVHDSGSLFIVTAAHVVRQNYDLHAYVPLRNETVSKTELWGLHLPRSEWVFHPNVGSKTTHPVDVAVMKIPSVKDWGLWPLDTAKRSVQKRNTIS